jgi:crossover junction endodeoxyribonuclease RusA
MIQFFVPGICKPAGSKRHIGHGVVIDACEKTKPWQADVKVFALKAYSGKPIDGPIGLNLVFVMQRPKYHFNKNGLKKSAPAWHISRPDETKLTRAVEDALTGIIWVDDSQICKSSKEKIYGDHPGVHIAIYELPELPNMNVEVLNGK